MEKEITKAEIKAAIIDAFPEWEKYYDSESASVVFDIPNPNANNLFGGLIIQFEHNTIWFRTYPPCSGGCCDSLEELLMIMAKIKADEMVIVVRYKKEDWKATNLCFTSAPIILKRGFSNIILSWSGKLTQSLVKQGSKKLLLSNYFRK